MRVATLLRWALLVGADVSAQIVFKIAGSTLNGDFGLPSLIAQGLHSPWVVAGFALYLLTFVVWMTILRDDDLSRVFPMTAITSVATVVAAVTLFSESLTVIGTLGIASIVVGVVLLARDTPVSSERPG